MEKTGAGLFSLATKPMAYGWKSNPSKVIRKLAEFVRDHRKRCADYDASKTMINARIRTARANPGVKWDGIASSGNQWGD